MKRTAVAASVLSTAALALLTACSGGGDTTEANRPEASRQPEPGPTERLTGLMVTKADLGAGHAVKAKGDAPADVTVDQPRCAPLADILNHHPLGTPRASLAYVVT